METLRRASIVLVSDGQICLMKRIKNGNTYFMLPGGKMKKEETPEEAALREAREELSIEAQLGELLFVYEEEGKQEYCFKVKSYEGEIELGGEEKEQMAEDNQFIIEWHELKELSKLNTHHYPKAIFEKLAQIL
jgi:8-oxo-dGTP diphosphatase